MSIPLSRWRLSNKNNAMTRHYTSCLSVSYVRRRRWVDESHWTRLAQEQFPRHTVRASVPLRYRVTALNGQRRIKDYAICAECFLNARNLNLADRLRRIWLGFYQFVVMFMQLQRTIILLTVFNWLRYEDMFSSVIMLVFNTDCHLNSLMDLNYEITTESSR